MADQGAATNWLDVLRASFWPGLALVVALVFIGPLTTILARVGSGLGPTQDIEIGPLKLQFSAADAQKLAAPSNDVASALAKLDPRGLETLLSLRDNSGMEICAKAGLAQGAYSWEQEQSANYEQLLQLRLVSYEDTTSQMPSCAPGQTKDANLNELGKETRRYLFDLLTKTLVISKS